MPADAIRYLVVTADDFGLGPAISSAILDLAADGLVTATVLLVTSPYAEAAVDAWRRSGVDLELGWHPCLTQDRPVLPAERVPSLVRADGTFWPLGDQLCRLLLGLARPAEAEAELRAQYQRFQDLTGQPPSVVNAHHHLHIFPPIAGLLRRLLREQRPRPYLRRISEPWKTLRGVPGAFWKRALLATVGRWDTWRHRQDGFPGNDWLAGVSDLCRSAEPDYLVRWLRLTPGRVVELVCHPGYLDTTLAGRDGPYDRGQILRRPVAAIGMPMPLKRKASATF